MPVVVAVLCAVVALVLLMVLLQSRGALASTKDALTRSEERATRAGADAAAERARAEGLQGELAQTAAATKALEERQAKDKAAIDQLSADLDQLGTEKDELQTELEAASEAKQTVEAELVDVNGLLDAAKVAIETHEETAAAHDARNLALTHQNEELQVELIEAADEAARRNVPVVPSVLVSDDGSDLDVPGFSPGMAWDLELVRSERTWRYSVAANPVEDPSPFTHTDNPLKLAIEIEALALREDVGAFIGIDWQAGTEIDPSSDPARAHLTLRLAQELLASAAREMSPSTLVVTSDTERGGVSLEVVASDPDDVDFKIPPPPIASEWIGIDEHGGMVVTVRSAS